MRRWTLTAAGVACAVSAFLDLAIRGFQDAEWAPWGFAFAMLLFVILILFLPYGPPDRG